MQREVVRTDCSLAVRNIRLADRNKLVVGVVIDSKLVGGHDKPVVELEGLVGAEASLPDVGDIERLSPAKECKYDNQVKSERNNTRFSAISFCLFCSARSSFVPNTLSNTVFFPLPLSFDAAPTPSAAAAA